METADANAWQQILGCLRDTVDAQEFRRWFRDTGFAGDSGAQITVWVVSEAARRHIDTHYHDVLARALGSVGRPGTSIRFIVTGDEDEDED